MGPMQGNYPKAHEKLARTRRNGDPKKISAKALVKLIHKFPEQAARYEKTFGSIAQLIKQGDQQQAIELLKFLTGHHEDKNGHKTHYGASATRNTHFGLPFIALAERDSNGTDISGAQIVFNILSPVVGDHPKNLASNPSTCPVLFALIENDCAEEAGKLFFRLATKGSHSAKVLAENKDAGIVIEKLAEEEPGFALRGFLVLATREPETFGRNRSTHKAIEALRQRCTIDLVGEDFVHQIEQHALSLSRLAPPLHPHHGRR